MPFAIFHLGPVILSFSLIFVFKREKEYWTNNSIAFLSLTIGSVIPDFQGFLHLFYDTNIPIHGISHTFLGAFGISILYSIIFGLFLIILFNYSSFFDFIYKNNSKKELFSILFIYCLIGIILFHFLPDITMHYDIEVFWPFSDAKFLNLFSDSIINSGTNFAMLLRITVVFTIFGLVGTIIFFSVLTRELLKN